MTGLFSKLALISIIFAASSLFASYIFTYFNFKLSKKYRIWDDPSIAPNKKTQKLPVPYAGTALILISTFLTGLIWLVHKYNLFEYRSILGNNLIHPFKLYWVIAAIFIMLIGGFLDDKFALPPKIMFVPINLAILITIFLGQVKITALFYPFNNFLPNSEIILNLLTFLWIGFCLAATKFLDGLDGLVGLVGITSFLTIAAVSLFPNVYQPLLFIVAIIWAAAIAGFLPYNFPDARAYLGEGGAEVIGFMIGVLSILSGAKVATSSTVIGWFILDVVFVFTFRIISQKPLFHWDRTHWHHRLLDLKLTKIQSLAITVLVLLISAQIGLLIPGIYKIYLFAFQTIFLGFIFAIKFRKN